MTRIFLLTMILAIPAVSQEMTPATPKDTAYQFSDAERLQISRLEANVWRSRYVVEITEKSFREAINGYRAKCESTGGVFQVPENNPTAMSCTPKQENEGDRK